MFDFAGEIITAPNDPTVYCVKFVTMSQTPKCGKVGYQNTRHYNGLRFHRFIYNVGFKNLFKFVCAAFVPVSKLLPPER